MINLNSVSKHFYINSNQNSLLNFITNFRESFKKKNHIALDKISFDLDKNEIIGLVGRNGSGKSTLLKVIAGILKPTNGDLKIKGGVVYLSGFYNGVNKNLSMKDNIYIIGALNGLSKKEIATRFDDILNFSELGDFVNIPLHKFSNGMMMRAVFSTTVFTLPSSPDILLLDEVLGGGLDDYFKEKALKKIDEYIDSAKIVIIASHVSSYLIKKCSRTIWLEKGSMKMFENTKSVLEKYLNCDKS